LTDHGIHGQHAPMRNPAPHGAEMTIASLPPV